MVLRDPMNDAVGKTPIAGWTDDSRLENSEFSQNSEFLDPGYTPDLSCPILGLFGEEDRSPTPEQVALHEQALKEHGKSYEFHMYPDAGHGFFYYDRPNYRQGQAVDGRQKIFAFLEKTLRSTA